MKNNGNHFAAYKKHCKTLCCTCKTLQNTLLHMKNIAKHFAAHKKHCCDVPCVEKQRLQPYAACLPVLFMQYRVRKWRWLSSSHTQQRSLPGSLVACVWAPG